MGPIIMASCMQPLLHAGPHPAGSAACLQLQTDGVAPLHACGRCQAGECCSAVSISQDGLAHACMARTVQRWCLTHHQQRR